MYYGKKLFGLVNKVDLTPRILFDGNTQFWYDATDLSSMTISGNQLSEWKDLSGHNRHLLQDNTAKQPVLDANGWVYFDGSKFMKTAQIPMLSQPFIYYIVSDYSSSSSSGNYMFDGWTSDRIIFYSGGTMWASKGILRLAKLNYNQVYVLQYNGAESYGRYVGSDNSLFKSGDVGTGTTDGFTLARRATSEHYSTIKVKEIIIRRINESQSDAENIYNYLKAKHNITTPSIF